MEYRKLGQTGRNVSVVCLGTMTWGQQNTQAEAHEQLDYALERGVNFIDTAEMYPVPPSASTYTLTEKYIGAWGKLQQKREQIILATKVVGPADMCGHIRDGHPQLDKKNIQQALDASLKRLKTDYIDLYQLHWPNRKTNFFGELGYTAAPEEGGVSIEETMQALQEIAQTGKVRHWGLSNETPWGTMKFLGLAARALGPRMVSVQNPYNLLNRSYEIGMAEISHREQCGLLAYSPLAFGMLSGKYRHGARPARARLTLWDRFSRYNQELGVRVTEKYCQLAEKYSLAPAHLALAFVNSRPFVTANIIGATNMAQLKENIDSIDVTLSNEVLAEINALHNEFSNPCP